MLLGQVSHALTFNGSNDKTVADSQAERIVNSVGGVKTVANHLAVSQRESERSGQARWPTGVTGVSHDGITITLSARFGH